MTVFFGLLLITLMGFAALVTDAGMMIVERRELQNAADAAALAGARPFLQSTWTSAEVETAVRDWAAYNGVSSDLITDIDIGTKSLPIGDIPTVTVRIERKFNLLFASAFGVHQKPVSTRAVAGLSPLQPLQIWPWSITETTYEDLLQDQNQGKTVYLKISSQDNQGGNFLPLNLTGVSDSNAGGAKLYEQSIVDGYNGPVPVLVPPGPWVVNTKTGQLAGPTEDGVQHLLGQPECNIKDSNGNPLPDIRCPLIGLLPVMRDSSWQGVKGVSYSVDIVNLPVFLVTGLAQDPDSKGGGKGHQVVEGQFLVRGSGVGITDPNSELNLLGIRLWE